MSLNNYCSQQLSVRVVGTTKPERGVDETGIRTFYYG